jgi:hypothetical protein
VVALKEPVADVATVAVHGQRLAFERIENHQRKIGGNSERRNLDVATICDLADEMRPDRRMGSRPSLVTFVKDRPGHDRRYAIDASKISRELDWSPAERFEDGLRRTVRCTLIISTGWRACVAASICAGLSGITQGPSPREGTHSRRRLGHSPLSGHASDLETGTARL